MNVIYLLKSNGSMEPYILF